MKKIFSKLLYAVFPRRCELCGDVVELDKARCDICAGVKQISGEICPACACRKSDCTCKKNRKKTEYKAVASSFYYKDNIVKALYRFKYHGYKSLADGMSEELAKTVKRRYGDISFDMITFVPVTDKKKRKRGYNQSQLLAEGLSRRLGIPCVDCLIKVRKTPDQHSLSAKQRRMNLSGAFDIRHEVDVDDKIILLVDDVKTTGSTLNECSAVLNALGAEAVYAVTLLVAGKNNE